MIFIRKILAHNLLVINVMLIFSSLSINFFFMKNYNYQLMSSPGYKLIGWAFRSILGMNHKQHVRETRPKVSPVSVVMAGGFRGVHILTFRTIQLHHSFSWDIRQTYAAKRSSYHQQFIINQQFYKKFTCVTSKTSLCL